MRFARGGFVALIVSPMVIALDDVLLWHVICSH
jgi:hypothetical protein